MAKLNRSTVKVPMPEEPPAERARHFGEVALGYTPEQAMEEAARCLQCKHKPCMDGCPVQVPIPAFIAEIAAGRFEEAYRKLKEENNLPAICGRVCPQESQCEGRCVWTKRGESVGIGRLERFAADYGMQAQLPEAPPLPANGCRVAVVGSGPAGLSCAGDLAKLGYEVTLFEALHALGGVLMYGIPEFRLPKALVEAEIQKIIELGVHIERNVIVGRSITIEDLFEEGYKAVFIGSGAGLPRFMNIEGENYNGVYSANEFLTRVNLMRAYAFPKSPTPVLVGDRVAVVGGGNVAMDAARTALRLGAQEVTIVYRRGMEELPARQEEIHHAQEEGIRFRLLSNPVRIIGETGWVAGLECVEMELGEPDASGRRSPVEKPDSSFLLQVDTVIMAIGQSPNPLIRQTTPGLATQRWGGIVVEEDTMRTSKSGVYAGGDAVTGAATVILAMGAGKKAAAAIHRELEQGPSD